MKPKLAYSDRKQFNGCPEMEVGRDYLRILKKLFGSGFVAYLVFFFFLWHWRLNSGLIP
jgi:hypothetical protein